MPGAWKKTLSYLGLVEEDIPSAYPVSRCTFVEPELDGVLI